MFFACTVGSIQSMVAFYVNIEREDYAKQGGEADAKRIRKNPKGEAESPKVKEEADD